MKNLLLYANVLKRRFGNETIRLTVFCLAVLAAIWLVPTGLTPGVETNFRFFLTGAVPIFWFSIKSRTGSILHLDFPYFKDDEEMTIEQQFIRFSVLLWLVLIAVGLITIWWLPEVSQWAGALLSGGIALFVFIMLARGSFYWAPFGIMLAAAGIAIGCALWQPMAQVLTGLILAVIGVVLECLAVNGYASSETDYAYN